MDLAGRLGSLAHTRGGIDLASFGYGYNALGSITQIAELAQTRNFAYDELLRLTSGGTAATPESYTYDAEGNRTASHLSASHVTNAANRLTEDDGFCYAYDANGNLATKTAKVLGACTGALTIYTWDVLNRLTRIDLPGGGFAAYRYDADGRRIEKDVNGVVTRARVTCAAPLAPRFTLALRRRGHRPRVRRRGRAPGPLCPRPTHRPAAQRRARRGERVLPGRPACAKSELRFGEGRPPGLHPPGHECARPRHRY